MLGNRPGFILLVASGMLAAHLPEIAHDSEVYQRYIGEKQHKHVPVEHLPYHPVHRHHGHHSAPHHANAKIEGEIRKVVRHMEHVKNRGHDEVQGEIKDVVDERNRRRHAAEEVAQVIREDGLRQKEVEQEIETVANRDARKHRSPHSLHKHHQQKRQDESGSSHVSHKATRSHYFKDHEHHTVHAMKDGVFAHQQGHSKHYAMKYGESARHQGHSDHSEHSKRSHYSSKQVQQGKPEKHGESFLKSPKSKGHAMPLQRRPYPSHHGVAFQKREDVDENVVYVVVTDYVTETIIPKVTRTRHITSTVFVEAPIISEINTSDETSREAEDVPSSTFAVDHTVTVTVIDTIFLKPAPETVSNSTETIPAVENPAGTAEQKDSSTAQGTTPGSPTTVTVEEPKAVAFRKTDPIETKATVTVTTTVLDTVTLTTTLEETVTQTMYLIAEPFEEDYGSEDGEEPDEVEDFADSRQSTTRRPPTTTVESEPAVGTKPAVAETTSVPVSDEAQPTPTELPARNFRSTHDTETAHDSTQDTKVIVADIEELVKGFDRRHSSSADGNPVKGAVAEVESQLKEFKTSRATPKKPSKSLTLEQEFRQACKFPYGSDAFWDCHHRFFRKPLVNTHHHHTRHGQHAKHHRMEATKGVESTAALVARLRKFRHRQAFQS